MSYMVQELLLGGFSMKVKARDMIFGYDSPVAANVNGGDFFQGAEFALSSVVTPVLND